MTELTDTMKSIVKAANDTESLLHKAHKLAKGDNWTALADELLNIIDNLHALQSDLDSIEEDYF